MVTVTNNNNYRSFFRRLSRVFLFLPLSLLLFPPPALAKELIPSYEWQRIGPEDTLPAGLEIRVDLSNGGKWARLPPVEINPPRHPEAQENATPVQHRCDEACHERLRVRREERRAAGFLLRGRRRQQEEQQQQEGGRGVDYDTTTTTAPRSSSLLMEVAKFGVGMAVGLWVASRFTARRGKNGSLEGVHES